VEGRGVSAGAGATGGVAASGGALLTAISDVLLSDLQLYSLKMN
jgi:hypothetical protein